MTPLVLVVAEVAGFAAGAAFLYGVWPYLADHGQQCLVALAAAGATGALVASGAATGSTALDAVLRALLGAGIVLLGARAGSIPALAAGVIATVASTGSAVQPLAVLATGLTLAPLLARRSNAVLDALSATIVVQVALRIEHPTTRGATALLAVVVVAPVVVAGGRHLDRQWRRALVRVAVGAGGFAIVGAVLGGTAALRARPSLQQGVDVIAGGGVTRTGLEGTSTAGRLDTALRSFAEARHSLDVWWARPASAVPVVAQHWRLLRAVAVSGEQLSASAARAVADGGASDLKITNGRIPLERITTLGPVLDDTAQQLAAASTRLDAARSTWLLPPLGHRVDTERARIRVAESTARGLSRALPQLPALLGADEPRRYFLAVQTPAESRAGGGFMGSFGEITADHGQLKLSRFGRLGDLNHETAFKTIDLQAPPDYIARYSRFDPQHEWSSINVSPDFPTVAGVIGSLYPQAGGKPIDGVIAVDPNGLAALLRLVGPVKVDGWPDPITSANAVQILLHDQYSRLDYFDRVDFLGDVAQEAWRRLTSGSLPSPQEFLPALGPAVRDKHLMMSAIRPEEARLLDEAGVSGRMAPVNRDFLGVITQNAGGSKIDAFLHRQIDYDVRYDPRTKRLSGSVKIVLRNDAPASGLPGPVIGNLVGLPEGTNKLYLSVYTPWQLSQATKDGQAVNMDSEDELGRRVYSTAVVIAPGASTTIQLRVAGQLPPGSKDYRLDVHSQPMVVPDDVRTSVSVPSGWRLGDGGAKRSEHGPLGGDRTVDLAVARAGLFG